MKKFKPGLLLKIAIAIFLGIALGYVLPQGVVRVFVTFNSIFGSLLSFSIPLIILGLVAPAIADLGKEAGKLLLITVALAYGFTLFSGFFTYFTCELTYPHLLKGMSLAADIANPKDAMQKAFFGIDMPPLMDVMTALLLAFILGLGSAYTGGNTLKTVLSEFKNIIELLISKVIIPLLPIHIFGIFLNITYSDSIAPVAKVFLSVIILIIILHVVLLLLQFCVAGFVGKANPFKLLKTMLPAYVTALGTQSSAATIPVTLKQTIKLGVNKDIAGFTIPLCATIHLSGSTMKIVSCALAIMTLQGMDTSLPVMAGFIMMLGIVMIAAPGVPGGAIMAALAVLQSMLGFGDLENGLMIAIYIALDSFGTACNVTGDGTVAVIVNRISGFRLTKQVEN
jgi:Na+/H+-dicarboxylate symporter